MNRIEQVAPPVPAQQPQPLLPRALADVRRRAAHAMIRPAGGSSRARRGTSGVAVAIAALTVPVLPGQAFGMAASAVAGGSTATAASASAGTSAGTATAPQIRHHIQHGPHGDDGSLGRYGRYGRHGEIVPGPGAMTLQGWAAGGWTLTLPERPADSGLWDHVLGMHRDGHYVPWLAEPADPAYATHPRPVVLPDGTRGEIAAYHVSHASPRPTDPDAPDSQAPADPADSTGSDGSGSGGWSRVGGESADRSSDRFAVLPGARSRVVPDPLIPFTGPANTKQMLGPGRQGADIPDGATNHLPTAGRALAASGPVASPCLRAAYLAGKDRHMLAHLHPVMDAMNVIVDHRRTPCTARVDYLSQARA